MVYLIIWKKDYVYFRELPKHDNIREYLTEWKNKSNITIKEIEEHFGNQAGHHWFEKSGSYPSADDWLTLKELLGFDDKYDNYQIRMGQLACSDIYDAQIKHVPTLLVDTYSYARTLHEEFLEDGYEGSIIRLNGKYKHGRSYDLMKFKDFSDAEATIVGYELGKGKRTGTLGKFLMMDDEGVQFGCPPGKGYNYKDLANMLLNINDYVGQRATFTYFQRTQAGSYRHPLFKCIRNYE